jgi:hypothetical protein
MVISKYFWNVLISIDQLFNTVGAGDPDETISSRAGKTEGTSVASRLLCKFLNMIDPGHCQKSIEPDEGSDSPLNRK